MRLWAPILLAAALLAAPASAQSLYGPGGLFLHPSASVPEKGKLTPEEEEAAEEALGPQGGGRNGEPARGEPTFVFVAKVSEEERAKATAIPVVLAGLGDPVGAGLVKSLARPGGNVTGVSVSLPEVHAKRLALLQQARIFFPEAFEFLIEMFGVDLLVLALRSVICPDPGVERVFIDP